MPLNVENAKYSEWRNTHTFENCQLNRKEYGQFLFNYLKSEKSGFVLNIDSSWGSGKTEFLKRFYTECINNDHPAIYIDAWESDFSKDPLSVVAFELLNQIECYMSDTDEPTLQEKFSELKDKIKGFKQYLGIMAGIGTASIGLGYASGKDIIHSVLDESPTDNEILIDNLSKNYQKQSKAIKKIKEHLGLISELLECVYSINLPLIILIDELDRCRPTYAIEMIEVVKHFFTTKNVVFIIATDTNQLCSSIKSVYGQEFDARIYLKRFFDRTANLPEIDFEAYLTHKNLDFYEYKNIEIYPKQSTNMPLQEILTIICKSHIVGIRDLDQILAQFHACLRSANNTNQGSIINLVVLFTAIIEKDKDLDKYDERHDKHYSDFTFKKHIEIEQNYSSVDFIRDSFNSIRVVPLESGTHRAMFSRQQPSTFEYTHQQNWQIKERESKSQIYKMLIFTQNHNEKDFWKWTQYRKCVDLAGYIT
ncbi:KAP family P-loop NTPase fold protein [Shewanella frigidimarina]|uniref:KAP family P-loop NTPase fold protein n=1 Tax=Shewanella frigidimarina TaxID=56812 RepID=UPI003FA10FED